MLVVHACPAGPVSRCYGCDRPVSAVRRIVQAMLLAAVVLTAAAPCLAGPGVGAIRFWTAPDHTRIVVDLSDAAEYSTRVMTNPDRVVVHVADGVDAGVPKNTDIGDGLVDRVRANRLESGIQIVADLVAARGYNVFTLKPYSNKPHRIVIDVFREVAASAPTAPAETNMQTRMVVIDPGHGGEDPGTLGNGELREKDVVLDIARKLAAELEARAGYEVHLTRTGDYFVRLSKRRDIAREKNGDIFISIHGNSAPSKKASGTEIFFVSPRGATDQAARELADRENAADLVGGVSPDADNDVLSILVDLKMCDSVQKSNDLASLMARELTGAGVSECVVKQAGFLILKSLAMPSVLVEVGFLSNSKDVAKLKKGTYREEYAHCLADAVDAFFGRYTAPVVAGDGRHQVAAGETLWSIARRYELSVDELRELNGLEYNAKIQVGQSLNVKRS